MNIETSELSPANENFNYLRKLWHSLGLVIPVFVYLDPMREFGNFADSTRLFTVIFLILSVFFILVMDYFRITSPGFQNFFYKYFGFLMKEEEKNRINATVPYFTANIILFLFFSREVAVISCIFLMFGDPFAAYIGMKFGKIRLKNGKSFEGLIAFFIAAFAFSLIFIQLHSHNSSVYNAFQLFQDTSLKYEILIILLAGSLFAGVTEFYSKNMLFGLMDDNLFIPVFSAIGISLFSFFLFDFPVYTLFYDPFDLIMKL